MNVSPRRRAREAVLKALYASDCGEAPDEKSFADVARSQKLSARNYQFAHTLFTLVRRHLSWADEQISRLAENWDIDRIAAVDHVILRMALVELEYLSDTPVKVVLNEAIELAKKFSTSESPAFVNGILDAYLKTRVQGG
jgi:N utilization substance protein B